MKSARLVAIAKFLTKPKCWHVNHMSKNLWPKTFRQQGGMTFYCNIAMIPILKSPKSLPCHSIKKRQLVTLRATLWSWWCEGSTAPFVCQLWQYVRILPKMTSNINWQQWRIEVDSQNPQKVSSKSAFALKNTYNAFCLSSTGTFHKPRDCQLLCKLQFSRTQPIAFSLLLQCICLIRSRKTIMCSLCWNVSLRRTSKSAEIYQYRWRARKSGKS